MGKLSNHLRRIAFVVLIAGAALSACHGAGGSHSGGIIPSGQIHPTVIWPKDEVGGLGGDGTNSTACIDTATPSPSTGEPGQFNCYVIPSSTVTLNSLNMEPLYDHGAPATCGQATWSMIPNDGGGTPPPWLTPSVSPTTTGGANTSCTRTDTVSATIATDASTPQDFQYRIFQANGSLQWCNVTCANTGERAANFNIYPGLHIHDDDLGHYVENTTVNRVAGQHIKLSVVSPPDYNALSNCNWTIPNFPTQAVDAYNPTDTLASPQPSQAVITNATTVQFYWTGPFDPSTVSVTCTHTLANGTTTVVLTATAKYSSKIPSSSVTAAYGSIRANDDYRAPGAGQYDYPQCAATPTPGPTTMAGQQLADGAAQLYKLADTSGTAAADTVGGSAGSYSGSYALGASPLSPDQTSAVSFSGGQITLPIADPTSTHFSVEALIKPASGNTSYGNVVSNSQTPQSFKGFELVAGSSGAGFLVGNGSSNIAPAGGSVTNGQVYHIVGVFDGSYVYYYLNGSLVQRLSFSGNYAATANAHALIGVNPGGNSGNVFHGTIQSVAIYPTALSAGQVSTHYAMLSAPTPKPVQNQLHYGNNCGTPGIRWTYSATADADEGGRIGMFQLVDEHIEGTDTSDHAITPLITKDSNNVESFCTDGGMEYAPDSPLNASSTGTWTGNPPSQPTFDSPAVPIDDKHSVQLYDQFDDYFMYKPSNVASGNSIWVTLRRLQWSWDASSTFTNGAWQDPPTIYAAPLTLAPGTADESHVLPAWHCKA